MSKIRPDSQDAILQAAFEVFSQNPAAGLGDVAERAGVGRATLHRYFPGRTELMRALAKTAMAELDHAVARATAHAKDHAQGFRASMEAIIPLADRQWFLQHEPFDADPEVSAAYERTRKQFHKDIDDAKAAGLFAPDLPTVWIAEAYESLVYAAWTMVRTGEATPKQAAHLAWRMFSNGLNGDVR